MSSMHPAVVEALARQRQAELLRAAELGTRGVPAEPRENRGARSGMRRLAGLFDLVGPVRKPVPVACAPCC